MGDKAGESSLGLYLKDNAMSSKLMVAVNMCVWGGGLRN